MQHDLFISFVITFLSSYCSSSYLRSLSVLFLLFHTERTEGSTYQSHHFSVLDARLFELFVLFFDEFGESAGLSYGRRHNGAVFLFLIQIDADRTVAAGTSNIFHLFRFGMRKWSTKIEERNAFNSFSIWFRSEVSWTYLLWQRSHWYVYLYSMS